MQTALVLALVLSLAPMAVPAQNSPTATALASEILVANSAWAAGILRQDRAILEQVMSPEYRLTFANNRKSIDRTTWMQNFMKMKMIAYNPRVSHVRLLGPDTVAATISSNWEATLANGKSFSETFTSIDTWQRIDGRWVAVGRHVVDLKVLDPPASN